MRKALQAAMVLLPLLAVGCKKQGAAAAAGDGPLAVEIAALGWDGPRSGARDGTLTVPLQVNNPSGEAIEVRGATVEVVKDGERACHARISDGFSLAPGATQALAVPVSCNYQQIRGVIEVRGNLVVPGTSVRFSQQHQVD